VRAKYGTAMKDLQAAAAILLLSQRHVATAIESINSKSDSAVPLSLTRRALALTYSFVMNCFRAEHANRARRNCAQNFRERSLLF
jgi:hypothetical protein